MMLQNFFKLYFHKYQNCCQIQLCNFHNVLSEGKSHLAIILTMSIFELFFALYLLNLYSFLVNTINQQNANTKM